MKQTETYSDSFEEFLAETADKFRMTPSVKSWVSIYHGLHPSRKWPSIGAFSIFLAAYFFMSIMQKDNLIIHSENQISNSNRFVSIDNRMKKEKILLSLSLPLTLKNTDKHIVKKKLLVKETFIKDSQIPIPTASEKKSLPGQTETTDTPITFNFSIPSLNPNQLNDQNQTKESGNQQLEVTANTGNRISYQIYAGSSYGFGNNINNNELTEVSNTGVSPDNNLINPGRYRYLPGVNLEAGGAFMLNVSKYVRVKAGMQLNYANNRFRKTEAVGASGLSSTQMNVNSRNGFTSNNTGNTAFANTYQIALPVGTEWELAGNRHFKWMAGATLQPGYILKDFNYSGTQTENDNGIQDPNSLRKWNLHSSIETFLSYQLKNGASINAGPQLRYQLYSSDKSPTGTYYDKFYQVGLKLGFSRNL